MHIHVFTGRASYQEAPFKSAMKRVLKTMCRDLTCHIEYKCISQLPKHWTPKDLIDWLLDCDFHFILTHTHQSIEEFNCNDVVKELQRLRGHRGFPQDDELQCPIFLQDKRIYIEGTIVISSHSFLSSLLLVVLITKQFVTRTNLLIFNDL
jgi:hypothetical protein